MKTGLKLKNNFYWVISKADFLFNETICNLPQSLETIPLNAEIFNLFWVQICNICTVNLVFTYTADIFSEDI
jgi:hypothetical protein